MTNERHQTLQPNLLGGDLVVLKLHFWPGGRGAKETRARLAMKGG
jgi:hypothetical protein